jgi:hypothetical protein
MTTNKNWTLLRYGNVVKWNDSFWIVDQVSESYCTLMSMDHCNVAVCPSTTWPHIKPYSDEFGPADFRPDRTKTVDRIEYVADCVREFINERATAPFWK